MSTGRPDEPSDKLDAALDGRPVEVDDDLAPLLETAARLRAALESIELDPETADRHLWVLLEGGAKVVPLPTPPRLRRSRWRRRVAAVALAAALTVLPATVVSASALPGQALYPVKLAVEQVRVGAVIWSSTREADERIKITGNRLYELNWLIQLNAGDRIPRAIVRLKQAYVDAQQAVEDAARDTGNSGQAGALHVKLATVTTGSAVALRSLQDKLDQGVFPASAHQAITEAIQQDPLTPPLDKGAGQPTPTTGAPTVTTPTGPPTTTQAPTSTVAPTTTAVPTTIQVPTSTQAPATTEAPVTTTMPSDASVSLDQVGNDDSGQRGSGETPTTLP